MNTKLMSTSNCQDEDRQTDETLSRSKVETLIHDMHDGEYAALRQTYWKQLEAEGKLNLEEAAFALGSHSFDNTETLCIQQRLGLQQLNDENRESWMVASFRKYVDMLHQNDSHLVSQDWARRFTSQLQSRPDYPKAVSEDRYTPSLLETLNHCLMSARRSYPSLKTEEILRALQRLSETHPDLLSGILIRILSTEKVFDLDNPHDETMNLLDSAGGMALAGIALDNPAMENCGLGILNRLYAMSESELNEIDKERAARFEKEHFELLKAFRLKESGCPKAEGQSPCLTGQPPEED